MRKNAHKNTEADKPLTTAQQELVREYMRQTKNEGWRKRITPEYARSGKGAALIALKAKMLKAGVPAWILYGEE